jgi:phosphoribosyl 1,2-cyclic phosphodiesterase
MYFSVLASGSKANSTLIVSPTGTAILIDCGLSVRECERRIALLGLKLSDVQAVLITHCHSDHVRGVPTLQRKTNMPVYMNAASAAAMQGLPNIVPFCAGREFIIGDFSIEAFSIPHDCLDPVGFRISSEQKTLLHLTDLGKVTSLVSTMTQGVNAIVLESNHDLALLYDCSYPWFVKQRIASHFGHLNNDAAADLLRTLDKDLLQLVVLAHLSEKSNTEGLALSAAKKAMSEDKQGKHVAIECASPYNSTKLFEISDYSLFSSASTA